jgi:hypothetical protein
MKAAIGNEQIFVFWSSGNGQFLPLGEHTCTAGLGGKAVIQRRPLINSQVPIAVTQNEVLTP